MLQVRIGASAWNVRRRFKDFDVLYASLCAAYGKAIVPPVPPKQLLKNESAEFLQRRAQLLATFLDGVLADKVLSMSAELCAFLECEAGSSLTKANVEMASCTAMLVTELAAAERTTAQAAAALERSELEVSILRAKLNAAIAECHANAAARDANARARDANAAARDALAAERDAVAAERDAQRALAKAGREGMLAIVCKGRQQRQMKHALRLWSARTESRQPAAEIEVANPLTAALTAAFATLSAEKPGAKGRAAAVEGAAGAETAALAEEGDSTAAGADPSMVPRAIDMPARDATPPRTPDAVDAKATANAELARPPAPPSEHAVKCGLLLKEGAGNRDFKERYFEMVTLGGQGEYGAFLVYYESELKRAVKGYISLEGAQVTPVDHAQEPNAFTLTTPARRLSVLTPGVSPGPLKKGGIDGFFAALQSGRPAGDENADANASANAMPTAQSGAMAGAPVYECPPSLEAKMSMMQKLDNWGRHALRNAMAQGPVHAPYTTWTLAATSAAELQSWLSSFSLVLAGRAAVTSPAGANGYQPVGVGRAVNSRTPVILGGHQAEEVM